MEFVSDVEDEKVERITAVRMGLWFIQTLSEQGPPEKDRITDIFLEAVYKIPQSMPRREVSALGAPKRNEPGGDGEEGDWEYHGNKKTKLAECDMPWYDPKRMESLSTSMKKTRQIIEYIHQDVKAAKRWVQSAPGAPANFPPSEWEAILRGEAVNLDVVFQSVHFPRPERTDYKPRFSYHRDKRHIKTLSDWRSAWGETMKATLFAFPHRGDELRGYESWIMTWFRIKTEEVTERILLFDEAVRLRVRGGQSMSLLDEKSFDDLVHAVLHPSGIYYKEIGHRNIG